MSAGILIGCFLLFSCLLIAVLGFSLRWTDEDNNLAAVMVIFTAFFIAFLDVRAVIMLLKSS